MKRCQNCSVRHADYATKCECGFDFTLGAMQADRSPRPSVGERISGKIIKVLGALLALIGAFVIINALNLGKTKTSAAPEVVHFDKALVDVLPRLASEINEGLPLMVDQHTRADSVAVGPGKKLTYNMTLVSVGPGDMSAKDLRDLFEPDLRTKICTSDEVAGLRSDGVTWGYKYYDSQSNEIAEIVIYPADCASR